MDIGLAWGRLNRWRVHWRRSSDMRVNGWRYGVREWAMRRWNTMLRGVTLVGVEGTRRLQHLLIAGVYVLRYQATVWKPRMVVCVCITKGRRRSVFHVQRRLGRHRVLSITRSLSIGHRGNRVVEPRALKPGGWCNIMCILSGSGWGYRITQGAGG